MKKNKEIRVKYSSEEYERILRKARSLAMPVSSFVRMISLIADVEPTNSR